VRAYPKVKPESLKRRYYKGRHGGARRHQAKLREQEAERMDEEDGPSGSQ
jgi:hypothetical protein